MKLPYIEEAVKSLFKPAVTQKYPAVKVDAPEGYRGKLVFDENKCIGCGICIRVCSPAAIEKTIEKTDEGQKITMKFNMGSCTFCQFCADFCPKNAITMSTEYSMVTTDKNSLIFEGSFIKKLPPKPPTKKIEEKEIKND